MDKLLSADIQTNMEVLDLIQNDLNSTPSVKALCLRYANYQNVLRGMFLHSLDAKLLEEGSKFLDNVNEAYANGFKEGQSSCQPLLDEERQKGITEGWALAGKAGGLEGEVRAALFNDSDAFHFGYLLDTYTPEQVKRKLNQHFKGYSNEEGDQIDGQRL